MNPFVLPSIGVDVSDESFKYMRFRSRDGHREVEFFGEREIPSGLVERGEVLDGKKLADEISGSLKRYKNRYPYLAMSLPEEKGFVRLIKMDKLPKEEVRSALEFQLEEHIPVPPQDLIFDFKILGAADGKKNRMDVVVTAYPMNIVESYMEVARMAGFIPIIFELESQAVARSVVPPWMKDTVLVGDVGRTRTTFSIVYKSSVYFTSTIKMGSHNIDQLLINSLHVKPEEANEIKMGRGFDITSEELVHTLSPALTALKDEAQGQIDFWGAKSSDKFPPVSKVLLCGGAAHLRGMPEFFAIELGMPVERARIWENVFDMNEYVPPITAHDTLFYATAFGLAMRGSEYFYEMV